MAISFVAAGSQKLVGTHYMVVMFAMIGAGQWLRYVVGLVEVAGAVGVLIPLLSGVAALGLARTDGGREHHQPVHRLQPVDPGLRRSGKRLDRMGPLAADQGPGHGTPALTRQTTINREVARDGRMERRDDER
jgi:hypothetical protein